MNFALTEDQAAIRSAIEDVCKNFDDEYWTHKDKVGGFPEDFYTAMASAGWLGIAMPEEYGGAGLGISEACLMMETVSGSGAGLSGASADRKSTRLNSSHVRISYAVFCLKKKRIVQN